MEIPDYKPNSHKYKQEQKAQAEEKRASKIIQGNAKVKKKSGLSKITGNLISDDARNIKDYIVEDWILPAVRNTILDVIINTAEVVFGNGKRRRSGRSSVERVTYDRFYDSGRDSRRTEPRLRGACDFDDIVLDSFGEGEEVIAQLEAIIDQYKVARVSDLYDLVGLTGPYTGNRYGWTNLHTAEVLRLRDGSGYLLKLPKAMPIEN